VRALACVSVCAALVVHADLARGFCRTTSSKAPVGYNPATSGCWTAGTPLSWHLQRVPYGVSSAASAQISLSEATRVADLAFGAWSGALCNGQTIGLEAYDDGPVSVPQGEGDALSSWASCSDSNSCNPQAHDVIIFDDASWPYDDPVNTLALTTVIYGVDDGQIFEAYTEVNTAEHQITTEEPPPAEIDGVQVVDLQAILTHEAGHFLGLAHATETGAIMYAFYHPGAIQLTTDDLEGICTMYPHGVVPGSAEGSANAGSCSCDAIGGASGLAAPAGAVSLALLAWRRRRARRASRPS
jgi:hypothetical protein